VGLVHWNQRNCNKKTRFQYLWLKQPLSITLSLWVLYFVLSINYYCSLVIESTVENDSPRLSPAVSRCVHLPIPVINADVNQTFTLEFRCFVHGAPCGTLCRLLIVTTAYHCQFTGHVQVKVKRRLFLQSQWRSTYGTAGDFVTFVPFINVRIYLLIYLLTRLLCCQCSVDNWGRTFSLLRLDPRDS